MSSNEVGSMFSNTGDASRPDPSTGSGVGGTFSNTSDAPSRSDNPSDPGGTFSNEGASDARRKAPVNPLRQDAEARTGSQDPLAQSAGYDNNMDGEGRHGGEGEGGGGEGGKKKHGLLSKVKDAFVPKPGGIGRTGNDDLTGGDAAGFHPERDGGRHEQANRDLNRE